MEIKVNRSIQTEKILYLHFLEKLIRSGVKLNCRYSRSQLASWTNKIYKLIDKLNGVEHLFVMKKPYRQMI